MTVSAASSSTVRFFASGAPILRGDAMRVVHLQDSHIGSGVLAS
ncbi:hypothetical protein [Rhodococcus sp. NPDC003383]